MKKDTIANDWEEFVSIWSHLSPTQKQIIIKKATANQNRKTRLIILFVLVVYIVMIVIKCKL